MPLAKKKSVGEYFIYSLCDFKNYQAHLSNPKKQKILLTYLHVNNTALELKVLRLILSTVQIETRITTVIKG